MKTEFTNTQYDLAYPDGIENHYWNSARNFLIRKTIERFRDPETEIIEIGCGRGFVVDYLRRKGLSSYGIELAQCVPYNDKLNNIKTGTDSLTWVPHVEFGTLILLDMIEHIKDPQSFINDIIAKNSNISTIIITVPARKEIWSEYDTFYGHHRRYDLRMTAELLRSTGFSTSKNTYFFHSLYYVARILFFLNFKKSVTMTKPGRFLIFIHRFIALFFIVEQILLPARLKGSSILCVGKRNPVQNKVK